MVYLIKGGNKMKKLVGVLLICLVVCFTINLCAQESSFFHQMKVTATSDPNFVNIEVDPNVIETYKVLDIAEFNPESDFDKDIYRALIIMFKDLYSLSDRHDRNMGLISRDVNEILKRLKRFQDTMDILEIRLDLLDGEVNKIFKTLFSEEDKSGVSP